MLARSLRRFYDIAESTFRDAGATFEVTPARFAEINSHPNYGTLVEEVPSPVTKTPEPQPVEMPTRAPESDSEGTNAKTTTRRRRVAKKAATEPQEAPQED